MHRKGEISIDDRGFGSGIVDLRKALPPITMSARDSIIEKAFDVFPMPEGKMEQAMRLLGEVAREGVQEELDGLRMKNDQLRRELEESKESKTVSNLFGFKRTAL